MELHEYDVLMLSQSWPQTSCWELNKKWDNPDPVCSPCKMPKASSNWTLHGLWPSSRSGHHPFNCDDKIKFNPGLLGQGLLMEMNAEWPTLKLGETNEEFWSHEWKKHGTCALDLEATNTLPKFFSKAVSLLHKNNMGLILSKSGISPGQKYDFHQIINVITNVFGVHGYIECALDPVST